MTIKCPACGVNLHQITNSHIKAKHPEFSTVLEFKNEFGLTSMWSSAVTEKFIVTNTGKIKGPYNMTPAYYAAMEIRGKEYSGINHWNYGNLTSRETKNKISKGVKNSDTFQKSMAKWHNDQKYRDHRLRIVNEVVVPRGLITRANRGQITKFEDKSAFNQYRTLVDRYTKLSIAQFKTEIDPNNLLHSGDYTLDHKFSKFEGFRQNVSPEIIGSKYNLEVLSRKENSSKRTKCSIILEELIKLYNN